MTTRLTALLFLALGLAACTPPPEAPTELGELSLYLFENFDDPDPLFMQAGILNMLNFLEDFESEVDLAVDSPVADRAWQLPAMEMEHWGGAEHWDGHDPIDQMPVSVAVRSTYSAAAHAELIGLADQTPLESSSSARYNRTFITSFDTWLYGSPGSPDSLQTSNEIDRDNILLSLTYTAFKDFRWIDLGDFPSAVVARSWVTRQYINEPGAGTGEEDTMDFFSNVELTIPSGDGSLRYNALWGAVKFEPEVIETILLSTVRNGLQEGYENTEAYLDARNSS